MNLTSKHVLSRCVPTVKVLSIWAPWGTRQSNSGQKCTNLGHTRGRRAATAGRTSSRRTGERRLPRSPYAKLLPRQFRCQCGLQNVLARYFLQLHVTSETGYGFDDARKLGAEIWTDFSILFSCLILRNGSSDCQRPRLKWPDLWYSFYNL